MLVQIRQLTAPQRRAFVACFLGWCFDAFDYFLLTFCFDAVAHEFHVSSKVVVESLFWTLAMRPVGALLFGAFAERFGRKPVLMVNIACFSVLELATGFAPGWTLFLITRGLFGIAMGGEWGVGAALALESLPAEGRGFFSGLLQEGYVAGNLLAAAVAGVFGLFVAHAHPVGFAGSWRMLFVLGSLPSLFALWVLSGVAESPVWLAGKQARVEKRAAPGAGVAVQVKEVWALVVQYWRPFFYLTVLMFAFTSFSHGTQDLYPKFIKQDYGLSSPVVSAVSIVGSLGAFLGGIVCGTLSERFGRRRAIIVAALLAIPMIPLWAFSHTAVLLACGGFLMQLMVQGAWGIIPVHLNELAPGPVRAIFPGLAYQLGNLLSSRNGVFQASLAAQYFGGRFAPVMAGTVACVALLVAGVTAVGPEAKGKELAAD